MPLWYQQVRSSVVILHSVIGVMLFGYAFRRRPGFVWRLLLSVAAAAVAAYFAQRALYVPGITVSAILTQSAMAIINYLLVLCIVHSCLKEPFWTGMYLTTAGMTVQGMAGCLKAIVKLIPFANALANDNFGILLLDLMCYGGLFALVFFTFRPYTRTREAEATQKSKAIFATAVLAFYLMTTWLTRDYSNGQSIIFILVTNIYSILVQFMIYIVLFGVLERDQISRHLETMRELMHEQRTQYEASRESVQLINEKYHDLKHLLNSIQNAIPQAEMERLSNALTSYDVRVQSGYEVLDVVLTEKMSLCLQRGITMTCNIGQVDLRFLDEMDLYTLFSNAVTNAVNAVSGIPEDLPRYIVLSVSQEGNIVSIHLENPCYEALTFVDGLPQTSGDPDWHGFGMKSMARTAEKYGGVLSASQKNDVFQLDIILLNLSEE